MGITYKTLISACQKAKQPERASEILEACANGKQPERALELFEEMKKQGLKPNVMLLMRACQKRLARQAQLATPERPEDFKSYAKVEGARGFADSTREGVEETTGSTKWISAIQRDIPAPLFSGYGVYGFLFS